MTDDPPFAARLNSFRAGAAALPPGRNRMTTVDLLRRAATVRGLNAADLNYPDHVEPDGPNVVRDVMAELGITLNGLAMRYYSDPGFRRGAFANPDPAVRQAAIDLTLRGIDATREMGASLLTIWPGEDGHEYPFQMEYRRAWDDLVEALDAVCRHDPEVSIAIEYKPDEPRARALLPDMATTLLAIREVSAPNLGATLDFAHSLYAGETPARAAWLASRHARLLGVHLNDGYGRRDDGLTTGSVHPALTVELLVELRRQGYRGAIYFDTFPDAADLDPVAECTANIEAFRRLDAAAVRLSGDAALADAIASGDAVASQRILNAALFGSP